MNAQPWSRNSVCAPSRGAGGRRPKIVLGAAIVLVTLGVAGLAVHAIFLAKDRHIADIDPLVHFKCVACSREFTLRASQIPSGNQETRPPGPPQVDCPFCQARESARIMVQCSACKEYFLPPTFSIEERRTHGEYIPFTCPRCGATQ